MASTAPAWRCVPSAPRRLSPASARPRGNRRCSPLRPPSRRAGGGRLTGSCGERPTVHARGPGAIQKSRLLYGVHERAEQPGASNKGHDMEFDDEIGR
eukprot:scaffold16445_cov135-Isochrysis_galbana.AAC.3